MSAGNINHLGEVYRHFFGRQNETTFEKRKENKKNLLFDDEREEEREDKN